MDPGHYSRESSTLSAAFLASLAPSVSDKDEELLPSPSAFHCTWAVHRAAFDPDRSGVSASCTTPRTGDGKDAMAASRYASDWGSSWSSQKVSRNLVLTLCLVIVTFTSSLYRCVEPLQALMSSSPHFLEKEGLHFADVHIVLQNSFALSSGIGLLIGLFLANVVTRRCSPKILGVLCVVASGTGLLLSAFADSTAAMMVPIVLLGLTCAMTNALLPVVSLFPENAALVYSLVCAGDFTGVIPLQLFRCAVEFFKWNTRFALSVYVGTIYPVLLLLVILLPASPFSKPEELEASASEDEEKRPFLQGAAAKRDGGADLEGGTDLERPARTLSVPASDSSIADSPGTFPPQLWGLSLGQQLCSLHIYGLSLWWLASSIGTETLRLYYRRALNTHSDAGAHAAVVVEQVSSWAACFSCLVLPAVYWLHWKGEQSHRERLEELRRLEEAFDTDAEGNNSTAGLGPSRAPGHVEHWGLQEGEKGIFKRMCVWCRERLFVIPRISPRALGLTSSGLLAVIGLLLQSGSVVPCSIAMAFNCILQALAPTSMFLILANTYGPRYFQQLLSIQVVLLASVGLLAPLFQNVLFTVLRLQSGALTALLLLCAFVGVVPLLCFRCTPCDQFEGKRMIIAATGLPLALERHSVAAIFRQSGADAQLIWGKRRKQCRC
ncbi:conserved hypothetical protein [Neospora caninum Liverpool]|uniref:MFS general substrate transporter n=1 Tax=Neospora caninum (strain Liverpool) TaxID=572307 RepID=F0VJF2_NEOCL|nr:conserved hypothetical protein [Neospora caninum Liverpool]CBZ53863.1 conserved hypothetical protein [Neospora caninum Liverpool]CEL67858.1 TPA: MFS general substrate transporter [Neospora caninum Liverpool]|eukprot:XP_003883895.1 conserved hypothetical protein [Neospora caninum Liverpool]